MSAKLLKSYLSIPLPSNGVLYKTQHPYYGRKFVYIRSLTVSDEHLLLNPTFRKDGTLQARLINEITVEPQLTLEDAKELVVADKQSIMLSARVTGYGSILENKMICPKCECETPITIDLNTTKIQRFSLGPLKQLQENVFEYCLDAHTVLHLSYPKTIEPLQDFGQRPVLEFLSQYVVKFNKYEDFDSIVEQCGKLPIKHSSLLRKTIMQTRPWLDLTIDFKCGNLGCDHQEKHSLNCEHDLFELHPEDKEKMWLEPFFILWYYGGMNWETYLEFPVEYKTWLTERMTKEIKESTQKEADIPSKAPHLNTPHARELAGRTRKFPPNPKQNRFT